ncbi:transketolase family protein [Selenomonas sp. F0473]|uniref:transketolase family protein n=1 Tax=Selenomonas sp. F0473 TaxID=999423 RepID=UPI0025ED7EC8|nr:transketolase C-terminal domain-containing protein [Selenomonas sp. F0473]
MRNSSTRVVFDLVQADRNVLAVTADNGNEIYDRIRREYPQQYLDFGIAECNMVAASAGLSAAGKIPFLYAVTNFMAMRAYEFLRNVVCEPNYNVKLLGRSASMVTGTYGMTHQGTEDLSLLRTLPNLLTITPATPIEARETTRFAYDHKGPVYIRLEAVGEPELYDETYRFEAGRGYVLRHGEDITVISMGSVVNEALKAAVELSADGVQMRVINMPMVQPVDRDLILSAARETGHIITLEEHSIYGGLGSTVAEVLAESGIGVVFFRMGLHGSAKGCGNREAMRILNGLDAQHIVGQVREILAA